MGPGEPAVGGRRPLAAEPTLEGAPSSVEQSSTRAGVAEGPGVAPAVAGTPERPAAEGGVDQAAPASAGRQSPFTGRQLRRLDEALYAADHETGLHFSIYVGDLAEPTRGTAEELHRELGAASSAGVLLAVDPGRRVLEIVTGGTSSRRLPDRSCALAALSMTAAFGVGDLVGGLVTGLRMLTDQAGPAEHHR